MTPAESKARAKADAAARAAAAPPNQVTARAPTAYVAPQLNVPKSFHETVLIIQQELTRIEQAQSQLMSMLEELKANYEPPEPSAPGIQTINGEAPDSAGNVDLSAQDVGAATTDHAHTAEDVGALPDEGLAPLTGALSVRNAADAGAVVVISDGSTPRIDFYDTAGDFKARIRYGNGVMFSAGDFAEAYSRDGRLYAATPNGFIQPQETVQIGANGYEENWGHTIYGRYGNYTTMSTGIITGQYYFSNYALVHDGYAENWQFRSGGQFWCPGPIYQYGGQPVAAIAQVEKMIEVHAAVLRSEIMAAIGRRLDAAGVPRIQN